MLLGLLAAAWTVCERWLGGNSPTIDAGSDNSTDFPGRVIGEPDRSDELCNAYRDFKNRPMPPLRAATGDDGRREIVLSLAVAERDGRVAAAYRGLDCLRRCAETPWPDCDRHDIEQRLRRVIATYESGTASSRVSPRP